MYKVGILGCGRLGSIAANALKEGKAPFCELAALLDSNEDVLAAKSGEFGVPGFTDRNEFMACGLDFVIEATRQNVAQENIPAFIDKGISVVSLSCGAFADKDFYNRAAALCLERGAKVYLATGCLGGFDLASVFQLMGGMQGTVVQYMPPKAERDPRNPMAGFPEEFSGTALEGFNISPSHLNTVIAGALACGELEDARYELRLAQPGMGAFGLEMKNDLSSAKIIISQNTFEMIALSTIAVLNRVTNPITF